MKLLLFSLFLQDKHENEEKTTSFKHFEVTNYVNPHKL